MEIFQKDRLIIKKFPSGKIMGANAAADVSAAIKELLKTKSHIRMIFAAAPSQYERIFIAYPEMAPWRAATLPIEATLDTGQTAEGTFVSSFRMPKDQWDARKALTFTFGFRYQPEVTVPWQGAVTDR